MITAADRHSLQALRPVALRARRAPSVHNTQPWNFILEPGRFVIRSDRTRQLHVLDPTGRQLMISCGCALLNARVAAAAAHLETQVQRLPDENDPDLVATLLFGGTSSQPSDDDLALAALDRAIASRQTNRRRFTDDPVPADLLAGLKTAAKSEGAHLIQVLGDADRNLVAELSQRADAAQYMNPSYRAELRAWTTDDPRRTDGVPAIAVPHVNAESGDEVPIRDFDARGSGYLPTETFSTRDQCMVLLGTDDDDPLSWLRAGEALERILLEIATTGFAVSPLTQVVEVASARAELRSRMKLAMYPHVLLRIGKAQPTAGTPRRHLADLLTEQSATSES